MDGITAMRKHYTSNHPLVLSRVLPSSDSIPGMLYVVGRINILIILPQVSFFPLIPHLFNQMGYEQALPAPRILISGEVQNESQQYNAGSEMPTFQL